MHRKYCPYGKAAVGYLMSKGIMPHHIEVSLKGIKHDRIIYENTDEVRRLIAEFQAFGKKKKKTYRIEQCKGMVTQWKREWYSRHPRQKTLDYLKAQKAREEFQRKQELKKLVEQLDEEWRLAKEGLRSR